MTFHASSFTVQWAREASEGSPPRESLFPIQQSAQAATFSASGTGLFAPLTGPQLSNAFQGGPTFCESIEAVEIIITNTNGDQYACRSQRGSVLWEIVSSVAGDVGVFTNDGRPTIVQPTNPLINPNGGVVFDGLALAAFDSGGAFVPLDIDGGILTMSNGRDGMGLAKFSEFVDIPPDTTTNRGAALDRLNRQFKNGSGRVNLGTRSDGTTARANNCDLALMPCSRRIFLRQSDIGNQNEQIPSAVASNTPGHFRFFPGAFFRRSSYVRDVACQGAPDLNSIIAEGQDFQPYQLSIVERAPTLSAWRIIVDGTLQEVWIQHPAGSDFRTAIEIWNGVWGTIIQTNEAVLTPLTIPGLYDRQQVPLVGGAGGLLHRMKYLQYAELLAVSDRVADITTDVTQTGAVSGVN